MTNNVNSENDTVVQPEPDAAKARSFNEWVMVSIGLVGLLSIMAMIISTVALSSSSGTHTTVVTVPAAATAAPASVAATPAPMTVSLKVKADDQHGRMGPDKQWHDATLPADFSVRAGGTVTITVANYDSGPHTFTSPALNVNGTISGGGSLASPSHTTFTFTAPTKPGKYAWWCAVPCDPWAMAHDGYMRGYVTVTA
jgi:heme/copper-type cytochrome/quinol oxidase subunit 2